MLCYFYLVYLSFIPRKVCLTLNSTLKSFLKTAPPCLQVSLLYSEPGARRIFLLSWLIKYCYIIDSISHLQRLCSPPNDKVITMPESFKQNQIYPRYTLSPCSLPWRFYDLKSLSHTSHSKPAEIVAAKFYLQYTPDSVRQQVAEKVKKIAVPLPQAHL